MKGKNKTEGIKRVIDFKKRGRILFLGGRMLQLLFGKMIFPILISEFKLRRFDLC
jgi:hypothetical protein